jgi:hypothetical protein
MESWSSKSRGRHMSETRREYAANYRQPPLHTPLQERPVRQPPRSAEEEPAGAAERRAQRARIRHDRRRAPQDHQARGGHHSAGQRIRRRQFARDQDADRNDEGHRKEDRRRTAAGAATAIRALAAGPVGSKRGLSLVSPIQSPDPRSSGGGRIRRSRGR